MNRRHFLDCGGGALAAALLPGHAALAGPAFDYGLVPQPLGGGAYVVIGATEYFSRENGANIVNIGFIVTGDGVVVIDTGPSLRYGQQLRRAIAAVTDRPVTQVLITHMHPDHFLGNGAFEDVPILAVPATTDRIAQDGEALAENLYRLSGDWMRGTRAVAPTQPLDGTGTVVEIGGHRLHCLPLTGHTVSDLAVFDETSGVLFAGDIVFHNRTPTTPHADLPAWLAAIGRLEHVPFRVLVPGHGAVAADRGPIEQTRGYLTWLDRTLDDAAADGLAMTEVMRLPLPPGYAGLALAREEFERSVVHLYPARLQAALSRASGK